MAAELVIPVRALVWLHVDADTHDVRKAELVGDTSWITPMDGMTAHRHDDDSDEVESRQLTEQEVEAALGELVDGDLWADTDLELSL
jgi:hypothetical protein